MASVVCLFECERFKISVLSALRVRPDILVSLPYSSKITLDELLVFLEIMAISSAYATVLITQFSDKERAGIFLFISIFRINGSMAIMNNAQLKASPCFTPLLMENEFDRKPFTCTRAWRLLCRMLTAEMNSSGKP